jgi:hypothetical protein
MRRLQGRVAGDEKNADEDRLEMRRMQIRISWR